MKRIITILLAVCMIASVFVLAACNDVETTKAPTQDTTKAQEQATTTKSGGEGTTPTPGVDDETTANTPDVTTAPAGEETTNAGGEDNGKSKMAGMDDVDFGGRTFFISTSVHDQAGDHNDYIDFWAESYTGDAINDAVYDRNQIIQKLYNCKLEVTQGAETGFTEDVATGTGKYIGQSTAYNLNPASTNYYNLYKLDVDLTADYFDQAYVRDVTISGKLYAIAGSWSMAAKEATWIMFYNKDVYESKFSDIDIYQLVREHKWTYDKLIEFIDKVKNDTDGNQVYEFTETDNADILGMATTTHNNYGLYYAGGLRLVDKDDNGNLVCAINAKSNASDVIDKMIQVYNTEGYVSMGYTSVQKAMQNGTTLFAGEVMDVLKRMKDAENLRVGVLPQPLFNEEQESYYHYVNNQAPVLMLSTAFSDLQVLSDFLTVFAYHSLKIVYPAFINSYKYTYASDEESGEMVEIILNSLTYDLGYHKSLASSYIGAIDAMLQANKNQYAQAAARQEKAITSSIATLVSNVESVDDNY